MEEQTPISAPDTEDLDLDLEDESAVDSAVDSAVEVVTDPLTDPVLAGDAPPLPPEQPEVQAFKPQAEYIAPDPIAVRLIDEEVLNIPFRQIVLHPELTIRLSDELEQQSLQLVQRREVINKRLEAISRQTDVATRAMVRHERAGYGRASADIQKYLKVQNEVRAEKAKRTIAFLQGVNAGDVAKMMNPRSKLDQVMNAKRGGTENMRKPLPLGAGRG